MAITAVPPKNVILQHIQWRNTHFMKAKIYNLRKGDGKCTAAITSSLTSSAQMGNVLLVRAEWSRE
jgi:hypothetical protein